MAWNRSVFLLEGVIFLTGDNFAYGNVTPDFSSHLHWWKSGLALGTHSHSLAGHGLSRWYRIQGTSPALFFRSDTKQGEYLFLSENSVAVAVLCYCATAQHWEAVQKFTLDHSYCICALNLTLMEIIYCSVLGWAEVDLPHCSCSSAVVWVWDQSVGSTGMLLARAYREPKSFQLLQQGGWWGLTDE